MTTPTKKNRMSPERRRLHNQATFWQQRYDACGDDYSELARVTFDRARAAARRAEREGLAPAALHELANVLHEWAERAERAEAKHRTSGNASGHAS